MKSKRIPLFLFLTFITLSINANSKMTNRISIIISSLVGLNAYTGTEEPFDRFPHLGLTIEAGLSGSIGISGSIFYSEWSDYLGQFGGKYSFQVFRPSLDLSYHFNLFNVRKIDLLGGVSFSYHLIRVDNELNNEYDSELKNYISLSPFLGSHIFLFERASGILKSVAFSARLIWIINGEFSGPYGMVGLSLKIK